MPITYIDAVIHEYGREILDQKGLSALPAWKEYHHRYDVRDNIDDYVRLEVIPFSNDVIVKTYRCLDE